MRFLIVNTDYPDYLRWLYEQHPGLEAQPYQEQMRVRSESLYGVADFYSTNLRALGHEAYDIYANNDCLQAAWAFEHGMRIEVPHILPERAASVLRHVKDAIGKTPARYLAPLVRPWRHRQEAMLASSYDILMAQIQHYKPDVLLNQAVDDIAGRFMKEAAPYARFRIGQHAATPLAANEDLSGYDLLISSFPPTVEYFRGKGIRTHLCRLGFEPRVLSLLGPPDKKWDISFAGSFFNVHSSRARLVEVLCRQFPQFKIWSPAVGNLPVDSPIHDHYVGQAWGRQMYQVLHSSKITINHHGDVAPYANNMRLFEGTGVGTCLLTDWKANLKEMFEPGKEVIAYRSPEECLELIHYYLEHDEERNAIARAGQTRTLHEHTYSHRMQEFVGLVAKYV